MSSAADIEVPRQLLAFRFGAGSSFEGQLVGALQRIESGGALRILAVMFVARDEAGELTAVSRESQSAAGMIGELISFRLGEARGEETQAALKGPAGAVVRGLGEALEPGAAVAGVLVEHSWAQVLGEAVARIGGEQMLSEPVRAQVGPEVWAPLAAAAGAGS